MDNKLNTINNYIDDVNINIDQILKKENPPICINKFSIFPYININNCKCKFYIIIFYL